MWLSEGIGSLPRSDLGIFLPAIDYAIPPHEVLRPNTASHLTRIGIPLGPVENSVSKYLLDTIVD